MLIGTISTVGCQKIEIESPKEPLLYASMGVESKVIFEDRDKDGVKILWSIDDTFTVYAYDPNGKGQRVGNFIITKGIGIKKYDAAYLRH